MRCAVLAVLANVTNAPASAGTTKEPKVYRAQGRPCTRAPWYNRSLTKEMYFRLQAIDDMERQLQEHKEMCKQAEAKTLAFDAKTLAFDEMQVKYDLMKAAYHEMKEKLEKSEQANVSLALAIADYAERLSQVQ